MYKAANYADHSIHKAEHEDHTDSCP